jgi:polar amino acid transport system substrate-binding protein
MRYGILLLWLLFLPCLTAAAQEKTLTIAADEWCPINCRPDSAQPGIGIELAKKIFEPLGYRINYIIVPWSRALEDIHAGHVDALVGAGRSDDAGLVFPTHPIYNMTDDFYALDDNAWQYNGAQSLLGHRIGVIKGYGYVPELQSYIAEHRKTPSAVQEVAGDDALLQNIRKLAAHRIDIIIESKPIMDYTLRQQQLSGKITWRGGIRQDPVFVAFSPVLSESPALAQAYDAGIERLRAAQQLQALYAAYGLEPPQ